MTDRAATKTPALRFAGFSGEWEERKLGEVVEFSKGTGYSKSDLSDQGTPIILYGRLYTKYQIIINNIDTFAIEKKSSVRSVGGEVIVPASGETAEDIAIASVVANSGVILGGDLNVMRPTKDVDSAFLALSVSNGNAHKLLAQRAQGKSIVHLHNLDLADVKFLFPKKKEQSQIKNFMCSIDDLIALHQQKYDRLQNVKKAMLEKMFPKAGSAVPEIRFAGFTDAWEERKFSEVATMHARIGWQNLRTSEFLDSGEYLLITGTDFIDGAINYQSCHYVEKIRYDQDIHIQIKNGSILITKDGTLGKVAYVQGLQMPATLNAGVFNVEVKDESTTDRKYLFQYLKAPFLMSYVDMNATGGTIKHLNQNILTKFPILLPCKAEQQRIGAYFSTLDELIGLQQRALEKLKQMKASMLEKMFV